MDKQAGNKRKKKGSSKIFEGDFSVGKNNLTSVCNASTFKI